MGSKASRKAAKGKETSKPVKVEIRRPVRRSPAERIALVGLLAVVVFVPLAQSAFLPRFKDILTQILTTGLFLVWALAGAGTRPARWRMPRLLLPLLGLLAVSLLSLTQALNVHEGLLVTYQYVARALIYVLAIQVIRRAEDAEPVLVGTVVAAGVVSILGLYMYLDRDSFAFWNAHGEAISTLGHTNYVGGYLAITLPLAVGLAVTQVTRSARGMGWGLASLLGLGLVIAHSRGAWLGAIGAGVFLGWSLAGWRLPSAAHLGERVRRFGVTAAIALVLLAGTGEIFFRLQGKPFFRYFLTIFDRTYGSNAERLDFWWNTIRMIRDHPVLGVGAGNFPVAYVPYASQIERKTDAPHQTLRPEHPHNELLGLLSEKGFLGLAVLVWLLVLMLPPAFRAMRHATGKRYVFVAALLAGFLAATIHSFFFYVYHEPSSAVILWAMLGLLEGLCREPEKVAAEASDGRGPAAPPAWIRWGLAGLAGALVVPFVLLGVRPAVAGWYYQLGRYARSYGRPAEAVDDLREAVGWDPWYVEGHFELALTYMQMGKYDEAVQSFRRSVAIDPNYMSSYNNMAVTFTLARKFPEAEATFEHIFRINKNYAAAHNNRGFMLLEQGKPAEALAEFQKALAITPRQSDAHYNLGRAYALLRNFPESQGHLRQAVGLAPAMAPAWYLLAAVDAILGDVDEAFRALDRAVTLKPDLRATAEQDPNFARLRPDPRFSRILSRAAQPATVPRVNLP